jgi:aminopeptidase
MTTSRTDLIDRYAELVVRVGVNVQPGQVVAIRCLIEHVELARAVTEQAYRAGASRVVVEYLDNHVRRSMVVHAAAETLRTSLPLQYQLMRDLGDAGAAFIQVTGRPEPDLFHGLDPRRVTAKDNELTALTQRVVFGGDLAWTIVAAPTAGWDTQIFGEPDLDRLWDAVATALRRGGSRPSLVAAFGAAPVPSRDADRPRVRRRALRRRRYGSHGRSRPAA